MLEKPNITPNIKPCECCSTRFDYPFPNVQRITCGTPMPYYALLPQAVKDFMFLKRYKEISFQTVNTQYKRHLTEGGEECCVGMGSASYSMEQNYVRKWDFRIDSTACGGSPNPCCVTYLDEETTGAASGVRSTRIPAPAFCWSEIPPIQQIDNWTSVYAPIGGGSLEAAWSTNGIINGETVTNQPWLGPTGAEGCDVRVYDTQTIEEYGIGVIGSIESSYTSISGACVSECNSVWGVSRIYDQPDKYRIRITPLPDNDSSTPSACRIFIKVFFTPCAWDSTLGSEVEFDIIDFKWKPGDDPYIYEADFPTFGIFKIYQAAVFPMGGGPPRYYRYV